MVCSRGTYPWHLFSGPHIGNQHGRSQDFFGGETLFQKNFQKIFKKIPKNFKKILKIKKNSKKFSKIFKNFLKKIAKNALF